MPDQDAELIYNGGYPLFNRKNRRKSARMKRKNLYSSNSSNYLKFSEEIDDVCIDDVYEDCTNSLRNCTLQHFLSAVRYGKCDVISTVLKSLSNKAKHKVINELNDRCGLSPLHIASRLSDKKMIEVLLEHGANVNLKDAEGNQPLHFVAKSYRRFSTNNSSLSGRKESPPTIECIRLLLDKGADVNARDAFLSTPLHYACQKGFVKAVEILLASRSIEVFVFNKQKFSPLHEAARNGHFQIVKMLLSSGGHCKEMIDAANEFGATPFLLGCRGGYTKITDFMLNVENFRCVDGGILRLLVKDVDWKNSLHAAIEADKPETVEHLLSTWEKELQRLGKKESDYLSDNKSYANLETKNGFTPLHLAAKIGSVVMLDVLFKRRLQINATNPKGVTPLHLATQRSHWLCIEYLLDRGCDPEVADDDRMTPFLTACKIGDVEAVRMLLKYGADMEATDVRSRNCLLLAVEGNNIEMAQFLLEPSEHKRWLSVCDRFGNTVLHECAFSGNVSMLQLLLTYDLHLSFRNYADRTPLLVAAIKGNSDIVREIVVQFRPALLDCDDFLRSPLHLAAIRGNLRTVSELLSLGASPSDVDVNGKTPLHNCIENISLECAKEILKADPSIIDIKTRQKETALHLACSMGEPDMVKLLLSYHANVTARLADGRNAMDVAIQSKHKSCVLALLDHESWISSMRNATFSMGSSLPNTPFRKMIRHMPDCAESVLNKCITKVGNLSPKKIKFNYEFLEDTCNMFNWTGMSDQSQSNSSSSSNALIGGEIEMKLMEDLNFPVQACVPCQSKARILESKTNYLSDICFKIPYTSNAEKLVENHPLNIMVNTKCETLLCHPVVDKLLHYKRKTYGLFAYICNVLIYVLYLSLLSIYMCTTPPRFSIDGNVTRLMNKSNNLECITVIPQAVSAWGRGCQFKTSFHHTARGLIITISGFQLAIKFLQLHHLRKKFLTDIWMYIEVTLYLLSIIYFIDVDEIAKLTGIRTTWQWETGAFVLLLSWINLSSYLNQTPLGIYVFMVTSVVKSFLQFFPVMAVYVLAFSFGFYVLLQNQTGFHSPVISFIRTLVMTMGEFEFSDIFFTANNKINYSNKVFYKISTLFLFVTFVFLLSLLLTNLLVGIAVDDIASVYDQALLTQIGVKVQSFLHLEFVLPNFIYRRISKEYEIIEQNKLDENTLHQTMSMGPKHHNMTLKETSTDAQKRNEAIYKELKAVKSSLQQLACNVNSLMEKETMDSDL